MTTTTTSPPPCCSRSSTRVWPLLVLIAVALPLGFAEARRFTLPGYGFAVSTVAKIDKQRDNLTTKGLLGLPRGGAKRGRKNREDSSDEKVNSIQEEAVGEVTDAPPRRLWGRRNKKQVDIASDDDASSEEEKGKEKKRKKRSSAEDKKASVENEKQQPSTEGEKKDEKKSSSWSMFGRKQETSEENAAATTSSSSDRGASSVMKPKRGGVRVLKLKSNKPSSKTDTPPAASPASPAPSPPSKSSTPSAKDKTATTTPPPPTTNTTTSDSKSSETAPSSPSSMTPENPPATQQQQQQQAPVIVMGTPGSSGGAPYRIIRPRPGAGGYPLQPQQPGGRGPPGGGPASSQNAVILAELLGGLLASFSRLWFITWLTRRLATQEEKIHAVQHFVWERLNDRYVRDVAALQNIMSEPPLGVRRWWWRHRHVRKALGSYTPPRRDLADTFTRTVVVFPVNSNDKSAGGFDVEFLASVITFLLTQHRAHAFGTRPTPPPPKGYHQRKRERNPTVEDAAWPPPQQPMELEVVMLVQSPGGSVTTYGLAAAQVRRLAQEVGISVTVCVDKYAASGGYMIASQAHKLVAAPFATIGSVGVIMEGLNFYEMARRYGVQPVVLKAGDSKNPFSLYGPISKEDQRMETERLQKVHEAFKDLIVEGRPVLADHLRTVADGSIFLGEEALDLNLVDGVQTSDEYILERIQAGDRVLKLHKSMQPRFSRRLTPHLSPIDILPHLRSWISDKVQLLLGGEHGLTGEENGSFAASPVPMASNSNTGLILVLTALWSIGQFVFQREHNMHAVQEGILE